MDLVEDLFNDDDNDYAGTKILLTFLLLFLASNYDNSQVTLLYVLFALGIFVIQRNSANDEIIKVISDNIFILAGSLLLSMIVSIIKITSTNQISANTVAKKRTWFFVYFGILLLLYIPYIITNKGVIMGLIDDKILYKLTIIIFFALSLLPIITEMNLLTNTYKCINIKETNITQSFNCSDIN
jgi:hypothetical protein